MDIQNIRLELAMVATLTHDPVALDIAIAKDTVRKVRGRAGLARDKKIVIKFGGGDMQTANAVAETIRLIVPMIFQKLEDRQTERIEKLVDALVSSVPLPEHVLTEARMNAQARATVLESGDWLTAAQLSEVAGFTGQNPSAQPNKWKREGRIFALRHNGNDYYPGYGLDREAGYRPLKGLAPILAVFGDEVDVWDIAIWFASACGYLGGQTPMSLLASDPDRVLAAARDEMDGVLHG